MERILNFEELDQLAVLITEMVKENDVIALIGDLGTGKTTFSKVVAKELGIKEHLKSPTFNYVLSYEGTKMKLHHFDVYRISDPEEIYEIGFEDYLHDGSLSIIEWADLIESELPSEYLEIKLFHHSESERKISIKFIGDKRREEEILKHVNFSN